MQFNYGLIEFLTYTDDEYGTHEERNELFSGEKIFSRTFEEAEEQILSICQKKGFFGFLKDEEIQEKYGRHVYTLAYSEDHFGQKKQGGSVSVEILLFINQAKS